ncbi:MAG: DUF2164 domain-containing protein [Calditrichaeota bacterium]|nr:MAG: DUF2164 domain-containing protein [Calditrichota bacterium]MBL1207341.1 DUF2164 domain-containing protein [Calditrichota bacterium]NOG47174.1 DUF2164 domain-containing protein [Calditrichota bacterium]
MSKIEFSDQEKEVIIKKVQTYFTDELDQEIGRFDAEFLLDFFAKELGSFFYNRGLYDAQSILKDKLENINDAIYELEKPTDFIR